MPDSSASGKCLERVIDTTVPHSARIWNYWLGGKDNYEVDRAAGDAWRKTFRGVDVIARASRQFLARSIRYLAAEARIRQFLDIGTGLPTADNTHEVAQRVLPEARIVYVDNDPLVLAHARALLTSAPEGVTAYIDADLRDTETILARAANTLDFTQPIALNLSGILGHIAVLNEVYAIVDRLMAALVPGSYLAINDGTSVVGGAAVEEAAQDYADTGAIPYVMRTPEEIAAFFHDLELVEPGVVSCPLWRPDPSDIGDSQPVDAFGGVGRKPEA